MLSRKMQMGTNGRKMGPGTRRQIIHQQQQLKRLASSSGEAAGGLKFLGTAVGRQGRGLGSGLPGLGFCTEGTERQGVTEK